MPLPSGHAHWCDRGRSAFVTSPCGAASLDAVVIRQAQAGPLNLEAVLAEHFGNDRLLAERLSVPSSSRAFGISVCLARVKRLQASLPLDVHPAASESDRYPGRRGCERSHSLQIYRHDAHRGRPNSQSPS